MKPKPAIKVAVGFYDNPSRGLPTTSGGVWVFSATTGNLDLMILDNGYLTELGTGAAGVQARYQLEALFHVRNPGRILVAARKPAQAEAYAREMSERLGRPIDVAPSIEALVRQSNLIITAMGSDIPHKRELDAAPLGRAKVVVDRTSQCLTQGELHHAVDAGVITAADVSAELGEIAAGMKPGRTSEAEITIADLTGVGVLDAAVANVVADAAESQGVGRWIDV